MLNIGQVVYDYTNERVVIFAGFEMFQSKETGKCNSKSGFILKDGTFIDVDGMSVPFDYANFVVDGKAWVGPFVEKADCYGHYFGIIDVNVPEVTKWAKEAIEETEALVAERGLNTTEEEADGKKYFRYHIGKPGVYKPKP